MRIDPNSWFDMAEQPSETTHTGRPLALIKEGAEFEAPITADKKCSQQKFVSRPFATLQLSVNHRPTMQAYVGRIAETVGDAKPSSLTAASSRNVGGCMSRGVNSRHICN